MKVSIIVPVFNTDKYLEKAILSILNQTYKNFELLLIDDGSTDYSLQICKKFEFEDERVKVFHTVNMGVSHARNLGLDNSTGDVVLFLDSDDWIDPEMVSKLVFNYTKYNVDVSICNYSLVVDNEIKKNNNDYPLTIFESNTFYSLLFNSKYFQGYMVNKLINKKIIDSKCFRFDETKIIMEDALFLCELFDRNYKFIYDSNNYGYYYYQRSNSVINNKKFNLNKLQLFDTYDSILSILEERASYLALCNAEFIFLNYAYKLLYESKKANYKFKYYKLKFKVLRKRCLNNSLKAKEYSMFRKAKIIFTSFFPIFFGYILNR